jgi:hypothetical protein
MAKPRRQAKSRSKKAGVRVPISNPGNVNEKKRTTMAKRKKRKTATKRRAAPKSNPPAKKRRRRAKRNPAPPPTRRRRRVSSKRRSSSSRRRRIGNPSGAGWKKLAMLGGLAVAGGLAGYFAKNQVEAHLAQPTTTVGLAELGLAAFGLLVGVKMGHPVLGLGFATVAGVSGAQKVAQGIPGFPAMMGGAPPQLPPGTDPTAAYGSFADAAGNVWGSGQMGAVVDVDDGDMNGAEGMAAVQDAIDVDDEGVPIFEDEEGSELNPYTGSQQPWG